jgi:hypothetical protein
VTDEPIEHLDIIRVLAARVDDFVADHIGLGST